MEDHVLFCLEKCLVMIIFQSLLKARKARVNLAGKAQIKINSFFKTKTWSYN